jgi:hypothetical protein
MAMKVDKKRKYLVTVDYSKTIEQLILEGHYNGRDPNFNSTNFQEEGLSKTITIFLAGFGSEITLENALRKMAAVGFRPATIKEFLTLAAQELLVDQPDAEGFVALGSTRLYRPADWVLVPVITGTVSSRGPIRLLSLGCYSWDRGWKFAVVPR